MVWALTSVVTMAKVAMNTIVAMVAPMQNLTMSLSSTNRSSGGEFGTPAGPLHGWIHPGPPVRASGVAGLRTDRVTDQPESPMIRASSTTRTSSESEVWIIMRTLAVRAWTTSAVGPKVALVLNDRKM